MTGSGRPAPDHRGGACPKPRPVAGFRARSAGGIRIVARTRLGRHLRTIVLAELALLTALAVPAALAETATATISVSKGITDLGEQVHVSGSLTGDPGCTGERPVTLQWQPADSAGFATIDHGATAADGAFAFDQ